MPNIYSYLKTYIDNPNSFAAKYRLSKKHNNDFHVDVDKYISEAGFDLKKTKMVDVFRYIEQNDIYCNNCTSFQYHKIDVFIALQTYNDNPIVFANKFYRSKHKTNYKTYFYKLICYFDNNFNMENKEAGKILYDVVYPNDKKKKCIACKTNTVTHLNYGLGYSNFCSLSCSRSICKMTDNTKRIASDKRQQTIRERSKDKNWIENRAEKLSKSTKKRYEDPNERTKQSKMMKEMILEGKFTPNITNSWTRWESKIGKKKFRSTFDALFYMYSETNNKDYVYEKLRIPYYLNGKKFIYITDYISERDKIVVEIKPESLLTNETNTAKEKALSKWCKENGYKYQIITEKFLKEFFITLYPNCSNDNYLPVLNKIKESYKWL
jgi:hypothetical protein